MELPKRLNDLVREEAAEICKVYKIELPTALELVTKSCACNLKLIVAAQAATQDHEIRRMRIYREAIKQARKTIYYQLRRYKRDNETLTAIISQLREDPTRFSDAMIVEVINHHVSTKERSLKDLTIYREVLEVISKPTSIIDVGCGMHPFQAPFDLFAPELTRYLAIDRDEEAITLIKLFAEFKNLFFLKAQQWELKEGWDRICPQSIDSGPFDLAFMMKIVPVLHRRSREELTILAGIPARSWVITGATTAMTRHQGIEYKDRKIIERFLEAAEANVVTEFRLDTEFVIIAQPNRSL